MQPPFAIAEVRTLPPALLHPSGAQLYLNVGKTKLYELIGEGHLVIVKIGARTMVTQESLDRFVAKITAEAEAKAAERAASNQ